jgi:small subunit ribosomal protein S16
MHHMVRIRLRRQGAKKQPSYRVVVADQHSPRDGRIIENIGFYNPRTEPETFQVDLERANYWLSQGAQPGCRPAVEGRRRRGKCARRIIRRALVCGRWLAVAA